MYSSFVKMHRNRFDTNYKMPLFNTIIRQDRPKLQWNKELSLKFLNTLLELSKLKEIIFLQLRLFDDDTYL